MCVMNGPVRKYYVSQFFRAEPMIEVLNTESKSEGSDYGSVAPENGNSEERPGIVRLSPRALHCGV
jgi:hypothetical protein